MCGIACHNPSHTFTHPNPSHPTLPTHTHTRRECPKNHIVYITDTRTNTNSTSIHLEHHKNSSKQGPLDYKVADCMVEVWELMEGASEFLGHDARALVFPFDAFKRTGTDVYGDDYFSTILADTMSVSGQFRVNMLDIRSLFSTMWGLYIEQSTYSVDGITLDCLREAAAAMTGSSSVAWDRHYDRSTQAKGQAWVLAHYPAFKVFVKEHFDNQVATVPRDPITGRVG